MTTQLVILCRPQRMSAKIQRIFAKDLDGKSCDEYPYHAGLLVTDSVNGEPWLYDMNVKLRGIPMSHYDNVTQYRFALPTDIPEQFMADLVGKIKYGVLDVALYPFLQAMRWNWRGVHCTEWCNDAMWWHGMRTPWFPLDAPPSPCALLRWAAGNLELADA